MYKKLGYLMWLLSLSCLIVSEANALQTASVELVQAEPIQVVGRVVAKHNLDLASELDLRVKAVAQEGKIIAQGGVVAELDTTQLRFDLIEIESELKFTDGEIDFAKKKIARLQVLHTQSSTSEETLDQAKLDLLHAEFKLAQLTQKRSSIQEYISRASIKAPFDLIVTKRHLEPYEYAKKGQSLVSVSSIGELQVIGAVSNALVDRLGEGSQILVSYQTQQLSLLVSQFYPMTAVQNTPYEFRADLSTQLPIGTSMAVNVQASHLVSIPKEALQHDVQDYVLVKKASKFQRVNVRVHAEHQALVFVFADLSANDEVILGEVAAQQEGTSLVRSEQARTVNRL